MRFRRTQPAAATIALRAAGPLLIELPLAANPGTRVWIAIIRPDPHPGSWSRTLKNESFCSASNTSQDSMPSKSYEGDHPRTSAL